MENLTFTVDQKVSFINKKKEIQVGTYVKDYLYKKTGQTFCVINLNGKKRLITKKQICNEII
jgi:hypothetical protein